MWPEAGLGMELVTAGEGQLLEILESTYPIWGEGLTKAAYKNWYRAQRETSWGRARLSRHALVEGGRVLASAKRYDLEARAGGRRLAVAGIGAVFTPPDLRGRGHARELVDALVADAARRGCEQALLFSEIGAAYYERLGFRVVPMWEQTIEVTAGRGAPAVLIRSGDTRDLDGIADLSTRARTGASFALDRGADFLAFVLARRRLLAGLGPIGLRSVEFFVTEEGDRPVAYIIITRGPRGVVLEDCGDRDPSGARVGAMLQVLAARTPAEGAFVLRGRLPRSFHPPQWRVVNETPAEELMMLRPCGDHDAIALEPDAVVYPSLDVF